MKVRFVGREYKWAEHREDLFSSGATHAAGRMVDFLALKMGLETFEADAVDAYYQAPEHEEVVVEPAPGVPRTPHQSWKGHGHCVATATSAAREACSRSELGGGTRGRNSCEQVQFLSGA